MEIIIGTGLSNSNRYYIITFHESTVRVLSY